MRSSTLAPVATTAGLVVLAWASVTGPVPVLGSWGAPRQVEPPRDGSASPAPEISLPPSGRQLFGDRPQQLDLSWIGDLLTWAVLLGLLGAGAALLRWAWRRRWRRPVEPAEVDFDVLPTVQAAAEALSRDADARMEAVAEGTPRDGIIGCWLRLERDVAEAGFPREPAETSVEFTVRVLHGLDVDPRSIGVLAALYREARFSTHPMDESVRVQAADALRRFQDDLLGVRR